jgi:hypothetical protein
MTEYAIRIENGPSTFRDWHDAYPSADLVRKDAVALSKELPSALVVVLKRLPRPAGHEIGAHWKTVATYRSGRVCCDD